MASVASVLRKAKISLTGNAELIIHDKKTGSSTFRCLFNPDEYNLATKGNFHTQVRRVNDTPIMQYIGGVTTTLTFSIFLDTSGYNETEMYLAVLTKIKMHESEDVSTYVDVLLSLVKMIGELHKPPLVEFNWGSLNFSGYVTNVAAKYVMFEKNGKPVRAKVDLSITSQSMSVAIEKMNPPESPDRTKCQLVTADKSIWDMAEIEYDDAGLWREIAKANSIMDPMDISVGTPLKIPAIKT